MIHAEIGDKFKSIPTAGYGWKIFSDGEKRRRRSMIGRDYVFADTSPWITWNQDRYSHHGNDPEEDCGFCFFRTKKEALRVLTRWNNGGIPSKNSYLLRIQYREGLGSFLTEEIFSTTAYRIAIAKSWRFIEEDSS